MAKTSKQQTKSSYDSRDDHVQFKRWYKVAAIHLDGEVPCSNLTFFVKPLTRLPLDKLLFS